MVMAMVLVVMPLETLGIGLVIPAMSILMQESEIRAQYKKWTNEIAQRNLNFI
jgi:hypothetical protein